MAVTILTANAGNATTQQGYSHHGGLVMPMHRWTSSPPVGIHFFSSFSSVSSATLIPQTQLLWKTVILFFYAYFFFNNDNVFITIYIREFLHKIFFYSSRKIYTVQHIIINTSICISCLFNYYEKYP